MINHHNGLNSPPPFLKTIAEIEHEAVSFSHGVDTNNEGGSSFLAYFNVVCVVAGTGALGLPYSLKQGGWIGKQSLFMILTSANSFFFIGLFILGLSWLFSTCKMQYDTSPSTYA